MFSRPLTRRKGDDGFTLIELLVVVVILGILIGIAIPVYLNYRKSANDKAAQSDLRNAIATLEVCNSDNGVYPTGVSAAGALTPATGTGACTQKINVSSGTTLNYYNSGSAYIMTSTNSGGSSKVYCYASEAGGSVKESKAITAYAATCPAP